MFTKGLYSMYSTRVEFLSSHGYLNPWDVYVSQEANIWKQDLKYYNYTTPMGENRLGMWLFEIFLRLLLLPHDIFKFSSMARA